MRLRSSSEYYLCRCGCVIVALNSNKYMHCDHHYENRKTVDAVAEAEEAAEAVAVAEAVAAATAAVIVVVSRNFTF